MVCGIFTVCFSSVALHYLSPSLFHASRHAEPDRQSLEATRDRFVAAQESALRAIENRPVYRYSVVPGGVRDVYELKKAAERDPVVAAHYAGFDYARAHIVRLVLARTAYISYRIGNKVYWTRHRVSLRKGETLITDGTMTARTRCANRVEEVPQQATSELEPPAAKFDQPVMPSLGTAFSVPPVPFESALLNRPQVPGLGPAPPLSLYDPLGGGMGWVPIAPPPLPGVCGIGKKGKNGEPVVVTGKKKNVEPCSNGGGGSSEVPEPGTWLLMISGLALIYWKFRHKFART